MTGRVSCSLPIGSGDWTAALADRLTGNELPIERSVWRGSAGRAFSEPSEASIVLDPDYAARFGRRPLLWNNELRFRRDDRLMWTGPIVTVDDDADDGVVWEARDRMEIVMQRRWFWRTGTYAGDTANLMTIALRAADYGDPIGLILDPRQTGVISDMPVRAGDKTGPAIERLGIPWTVVGDVVRYGDILVDTELDLPADAFGDERPSIVADGYERLSHVAAVTENNGRVFFPSPDPGDRPPGSPLLVDTIDVGDVSTGAAKELARQEWLRRQGELSIVADERRPLTADFPLQWDDLVPGAVLLGSSQGRQLTADNVPIRLDGVSVELADGKELDATGRLYQATEFDLGSPYLHRLKDLEPIAFPDIETYPLAQLDDIDWSGLGLAPLGEFDVGIGAAPFPGIEPIDFAEFEPIAGIDGIDSARFDPFAGCPPAYCCDQCDTGTGGGGGGGFVRSMGTHDFHTLKASPIVLCGEEYSVAPSYAAGDLLIAHVLGQGVGSISFDAGSGWTEHINGTHDGTNVLLATATDPTSFDIVWPEPVLESLDGQIAVIAGGTVNATGFKNSDVDGFPGASALPQVTTTVDGCLIMYGIIGSGNEINQVVAPGLQRLQFNQFGEFCVMLWERQTSAGLTTARTVTYPAGEYRTEWIIAVAP